MKKYFKVKKIFLENEILENKFLEIENGKMGDILDFIGENEKYIDYSDCYISPGFVDTHIHGMVGHDIMDATRESLLEISKAAGKVGVTAFLPTTLTASNEDTKKAIENISKNYKDAKGAKILGIFLEGPFFSEKFKGAQNPIYFKNPNLDLLLEWKESAGVLPIKIAVAPEKEGAMEFIKKAKELGFFIAIGHTDATYEQAKEAVENGANIFVHTYNAMSPLHHRKPGVVGAAFTLKNVFAELICDGHHVHPVSAEILIKTRTPESVALVTDCMSATLMLDGEYKLGEFDVIVENGTARMKDGNLAGSILLLKDAVKNVISWGIASELEAIKMATIVPAKSVGIDDRVGKIEKGRDADFVILDKEFNLKATYINGELFE